MTAVGLLDVAGYAAAAVAVGAGAWAARIWHQASRVPITATWQPGSEPFDPQQSTHGWTVATILAFEEAGRLNAKAARWSAAAVGATEVQALIAGVAAYLKP